MPILCFEGPSAVGKTTTAAALVTEGAFVVPEVNQLFQRPADAAPGWYLERQAERWQRARDALRQHPLVVLDGDPFQPLWYNWAYDFAERQPLDFMEAFYRERVAREEMGFPDRYVVFGASEGALRQRKASDPTRLRRAFEAHLGFIEPQRRYFREMRALRPERVRFLQAETVGENVRAVLGAAADAPPEREPLDLLGRMVRWLRENPARSPEAPARRAPPRPRS